MDSSMPTIYTTASPSVSDEQFNSFHSIDRTLYKRLIVNLGREPAESMHVMAFWLWLEQEITRELTMVNTILSFPAPLINDVADESVVCLKCVESDTFPPVGENPEQELVLLSNMVGRNISLQFFYENRIGVLRGVKRMVGEVCVRAFRDILQNTFCGRLFVPISLGSSETSGRGRIQGIATPVIGKDRESISRNAAMLHAPAISYPFYPTTGVVFPLVFEGVANFGSQILPSENVQVDAGAHGQININNNELSHMFSNILNVDQEEVVENDGVSPDERTIFLTFSKGYPISESEVGEFFTGKFGDFIEAVYMQEVPKGEQVLYARVVARSASIVDAVVEGGRAKYNINGKHVWARKYVRKQKSSPRAITES